MNSTQSDLVKHTFITHVQPLGNAAATLFYQNLFALDASLRTLFKSDMASQEQKLLQALAFVVNGLDKPEQILDAVRQLGQRHAQYGVQHEHYATVGAALLQTLQAAIGAAWTPEVHNAWADAYALLASTMQTAAPAPVS
jgi:hemoglobin-like flavoprotein